MSSIFKKHKIDQDLYKVFNALSNPVRYEVYVKILHEACECDLTKKSQFNGNCVTEIAKSLKIGQPTVSNHIKELVNCGLVTTQKIGRKVYLFGSEQQAEKLRVFGNFCVQEVRGELH